MRVLLLALPIAAFAAAWAALLGSRRPRGSARVAGCVPACRCGVGDGGRPGRRGLSWFGAIRQGWLGVFWGLLLCLIVYFAVRQQLFQSAWSYLRALKPAFSLSERLILLGVASVVLLLLLIAWVSPPNNYDSYLYHMARVVHWAQAGSLDHFPSGFEHQLTKPTWAETAILHLRVLWGDDRPANLVQWFSMIGSLVGVSAIAAHLGASRKAQLLAITIALSIPMGILQATSTQNDYVVAFWMVCLAYFVLRRRRVEGTSSEVVLVGLAAGLGLLTKGTGYVYAVPLLAWYFWPRRPWPRLRVGAGDWRRCGIDHPVEPGVLGAKRGDVWRALRDVRLAERRISRSAANSWHARPRERVKAQPAGETRRRQSRWALNAGKTAPKTARWRRCGGWRRGSPGKSSRPPNARRRWSPSNLPPPSGRSLVCWRRPSRYSRVGSRRKRPHGFAG